MSLRRRLQKGDLRLRRILTHLGVLWWAAFPVGALAQNAPDTPPPLNELPKDRVGWVRRLRIVSQPQGADWWALEKFMKLPPDQIGDICAELWKANISEQLKQHLLGRVANEYGAFRIGSNGLSEPYPEGLPCLMDVLHLGATDKNPAVQKIAFQALFQVALTDFPDATAYLAWRKQMNGRATAEIIRANLQELVRNFAQAGLEQKSLYLGKLNRLSFQNGTYTTNAQGKTTRGVISVGLNGVRRRAALEAGVIAALQETLRADLPPALEQQTVQFVVNFQVMEDDFARIEEGMRRVVTRLTERKQPVDYTLIAFLGQHSTRWTTELLLKIVEREYPGQNPWMLQYALAQSSDPRIIPTLIALLEVADSGNLPALQHNLARLTQVRFSADQDSEWWREWWEKNRNSLPEEVRSRTIPALKGVQSATDFFLRRRSRRYTVADDPTRTYLLLTPGVTLTRTQLAKNAPSKDDPFADIPMATRPGLIVVLTDRYRNFETLQKHWESLLTEALQNRYIVAVALVPSLTQTPFWATAKNPSLAEANAPQAERFTREIVAEAQKRHPICPDRIFLHGIGEGGLAAYSCSLEPQTPFRGFIVQSATFRSAQLPSLTPSKKRRYVIQHSPDDRTRPYVLAQAAQELLTKAGADAVLTRLPAALPTTETNLLTAGKELAEAIQRLEKAK